MIVITQVAFSVPFDNATNGFVFENVQEAIEEGRSKVSINDTLAKPLINKLVAGSVIVLTEVNDGSDETLRVDSTDHHSGIDQINSGEMVTIQARKQMIIRGTHINRGTLINRGTMVLL